jgi:hypothetical protein
VSQDAVRMATVRGLKNLSSKLRESQ